MQNKKSENNNWQSKEDNIMLEIREANKRAQHYYEKNGFVSMGITRSYLIDL